MMGVVNGAETGEPEWMKDFRLKKERRAEEEKRRKEREDQKKQAIPSWKRDIIEKRIQKVLLKFGSVIFGSVIIVMRILHILWI